MQIFVLSIYLFSFLFYVLAYFLRPRFFRIIALSSLSSGLLGNLYLIIEHFLRSHRLPLTNIAETLLSTVSIIVLVYLVLEFRKRRPILMGLLVSLISSLGLMAVFRFSKGPLMPLLPALQSKWLVFHVSSCIVAYSFFAVSFIAAIVYLTSSTATEKGRRPGSTLSEAEGLTERNPESDHQILLNRLCHRCICIGFFLLTLGIILGSVWGRYAWGHWWSWDAKEVWALITWLIYASYIYGRLSGDWSERKLSWIAISGFSACLFTYLGVTFLLRGLHSYT